MFVVVHRVRPPPAAGGELEERVPPFVSVQTKKREGPRRQHERTPFILDYTAPIFVPFVT